MPEPRDYEREDLLRERGPCQCHDSWSLHADYQAADLRALRAENEMVVADRQNVNKELLETRQAAANWKTLAQDRIRDRDRLRAENEKLREELEDDDDEWAHKLRDVRARLAKAEADLEEAYAQRDDNWRRLCEANDRTRKAEDAVRELASWDTETGQPAYGRRTYDIARRYLEPPADERGRRDERDTPDDAGSLPVEGPVQGESATLVNGPGGSRSSRPASPTQDPTDLSGKALAFMLRGEPKPERCPTCGKNWHTSSMGHFLPAYVLECHNRWHTEPESRGTMKGDRPNDVSLVSVCPHPVLVGSDSPHCWCRRMAGNTRWQCCRCKSWADGVAEPESEGR